MKVIPLKKNKKLIGYMVTVNTEEANKLIASLALQMKNKNPDTDRDECYTEDGLYFSISVNFDKENEDRKLRKEILKEWDNFII